jgi:hypothetical protein
MNTFTPTYATTTLTLPFTNDNFATGVFTFTGTTNSVTALSISGGVVYGQYTIILINNGSGAVTITPTSSVTQRFTFTTITVNASRYAILTVVYATSAPVFLISGAPYNN